MEGCISYDLKDAMEKHLKECKACRDVHSEELFIDKALSAKVNCDDVKFSSIAADVMKNIDRTKYQKRSGNKIFFSIKEHLPACAAIAALIAISITVAPAYFKNNNEIPLKPLSMTAEEPANEKTSNTPTAVNEIEATKSIKKYSPELKKSLFINEPKSFTPWKKSLNNKYTACVEGRGLNGTDQEIASIIVKTVASGEMWRFELNEDTNIRSNTPKVLEWWDDENILVVFGYAYGEIAPGGDLYILNVETGAFNPAYEIKDKKNQIVCITKTGNDLKMDMHIFDDRQTKTFHKEKWSISSFDITLNKEMEVKNSKGEKINAIGGVQNNN